MRIYKYSTPSDSLVNLFEIFQQVIYTKSNSKAFVQTVMEKAGEAIFHLFTKMFVDDCELILDWLMLLNIVGTDSLCSVFYLQD